MRTYLRHPLLWLLALCTVAIVVLHALDVASIANRIDPVILVVISISYGVSALSMLVRTGWRNWSILGAGLVATLIGDTVFWVLALLRAGGWTPAIDHRDDTLDVTRALFAIGGPFVLVGLAREWWADRKSRFGGIGNWTRRRPGRNRNDETGAAT